MRKHSDLALVQHTEQSFAVPSPPL
jgi:hypothetical protein